MAQLPADKMISCFYESTKDCVKVIDTHAILHSFNPYGLKAMEIDDAKDVIGRNWLDFWQGDASEVARRAFNEALEGRIGHFEGYCPTVKGTPKWWEVTVAPLHNEYGEVQWILASSRDITNQMKLKQELEQQRQENELLRKKLAQLSPELEAL